MNCGTCARRRDGGLCNSCVKRARREAGGARMANARDAFFRGASVAELAAILNCTQHQADEWTADPFGPVPPDVRRPVRRGVIVAATASSIAL